MNALIFNREEFQHPADGWYQIEPKGEHANRGADLVQVIDDQACAEIVRAFNRIADDSKFPGMLVDHEHFKHDQSKETRAYGWLMRLENRADGMYGRIKWTDTGRAAVDGGDYRFFSTEYDRNDLAVLNSRQEPKRVRPMRLAGLTLTNEPNNMGGKPITNRAPDAQSETADPVATANQISGAARRLQKESGISFEVAWNRARQLFPSISAAAGRPPQPCEQVDNRASVATAAPCRPNLAAMAGRALKVLTNREQQIHGISFGEAWERIVNRHPGLVGFEDVQANWDKLQDLEPAAHQAYLEAGLDLEKQKKLPFVYKQYGPNGGYPITGDFYKTINRLIIQRPDLGFTGRWEEMKKQNPLEFWNFVLSFSGHWN